MSLAKTAVKAAPPRSERGIISVIDGGAAEAAAEQGRLERRPTPDPAEAALLTPRHYQTALGLLECAARALEILYNRRDRLEAAIEDVSARAEGAVSAAQAKVLDWQKLAAGFKTESQEAERRLVAMQQRAELAEAQLEAERARADSAERRAAEALGLSQGLHAKIISAFGRGSTAHKALLVAVDDAKDA